MEHTLRKSGTGKLPAGLVHGLRILRRKVHGPRADDHVALRRPQGRQVPRHLALRLLRLESRETGGPRRYGD